MSTLVMSAEMLLSRSPPSYSHSPPAGFLIDYCNTNFKSSPRIIQSNRLPLKKKSQSCGSFWDRSDLATSLRSCLRKEETNNKKKVVFADAKGMSLTQIRVMTEPSNVPPLWSMRFLSQVTKGVVAEPLPEPWEITFPQPASDYIDFRLKIDTKNVSLENVIVRESENLVIGTIKVKNIAFNKEVIVRSTGDSWKTQEDTYCTFVANLTTDAANVYVLYDTFSFKLQLPPKSRKLEFCICFKCNDQEYWDNNGDKNYVFIKKAQISPTFVNDCYTTKYSEVSSANVETWSEFASGTHLDTQGPYW